MTDGTEQSYVLLKQSGLKYVTLNIEHNYVPQPSTYTIMMSGFKGAARYIFWHIHTCIADLIYTAIYVYSYSPGICLRVCVCVCVHMRAYYDPTNTIKINTSLNKISDSI